MNPALMKWARETAGLSLDEAAKALGMASVDRLSAIESGDHEPSRSVLLRMSKQYRRSLLTFYLSAPPAKGNRGQDFRTLPAELTVSEDALLDALVRDVMGRQNMVRSIVEEEEEGQPLHFIGSCSLGTKPEDVLASIVKTLRLDLGEFRKQRSAEEGFTYLRERAEAAGIFVLLIGNLGSHHSTISVEAFRGFAVADALAPFVVINDQDAKPAWSFTLLHELAHLWLGATGVSGGSAEKEIEQFCNETAGLFLLPRYELKDLPVANKTSIEEAIKLITRFASERHLSRKMVAYTLLRAGQIEWTTWRSLDQAVTQIWHQERERQKEKARETEGGPNYYTVRRHKLGKALLSLVDRMMGAGSLTPVKAAKMLGVKPRSVYPLLVGSRLGGGDARGRA